MERVDYKNPDRMTCKSKIRSWIDERPKIS